MTVNYRNEGWWSPVRATESLRTLHIPTDGENGKYGPRYETGRPAHHADATAPATALFENLPEHCCAFIRGAAAVTGCVAWLTNELILRELAAVPKVSVIVQKEDFLRPDSPGQHKQRLRQLYARITALGGNETPAGLSTFSNHGSDAVRCMGVANRSQKSAVPRMHHKFLVRYEYQHPQHAGTEAICDGYLCEGKIEPVAVWTGSFNMTHNGANSLENAVVIADKVIAQRYADEWAWVYGLSEPLNWQNDWVEPEFRFGT